MNAVDQAIAVAFVELAAKQVVAEAPKVLIRDLIKADEKYQDEARRFGERGVLADTDGMAADVKKDRDVLREELYQQLSQREGGLAAKAAKLDAAKWDDLTGHERKEYQKARNNVKNMVDSRWKRLRAAWAAIQAEDAAKAEGEPSSTEQRKDLMERWTLFYPKFVAANKNSKFKFKKVKPEVLDALIKAFTDGLEAALKQ